MFQLMNSCSRCSHPAPFVWQCSRSPTVASQQTTPVQGNLVLFRFIRSTSSTSSTSSTCSARHLRSTSRWQIYFYWAIHSVQSKNSRRQRMQQRRLSRARQRPRRGCHAFQSETMARFLIGTFSSPVGHILQSTCLVRRHVPSVTCLSEREKIKQIRIP